MAKTTGGAIIAKMLQKENVDTIFGIIDGTYLRMLEAMKELGMNIVTPRHEANAAHMAGAYARMTGKLGVCIASNGPGVANVLPGVAVENAEGNRVLLITSSRRSGITYPDRGGAYQCFDQVGVISAMSKWSQSASTIARIPELMRQALRKCYEGRPGVVHLDVPENLMNGPCAQVPFQAPGQYRRIEPICPPKSQVQRAAEMLKTAKLPIIHTGSGIIHSQAFEELKSVAEALHSPVTTSWSSRGALPETSELAWPMIHIEAVNKIRNKSDLVLVLGSELGETDWWAKQPYWGSPVEQKFIQVDVDEEKLGRNRPVELAIMGDAKVFLCMLLEEIKGQDDLSSRKTAVAKLREEISKDRAKLDEKLEDKSTPMITAHVGAICSEVCDDDAVVIFDGGNTAVWGNFFYKIKTPNTQMGTHHMGHLGAGIGQALGAKVARPDKQVICIIGDGAMGFNPQEIETAVRNSLPIVFIVCCDKQWGMVKMTQCFTFKPLKTMIKKTLPPEETINTELNEIEFDKLANSMGAIGKRISAPDEFKTALKECLASGECSVIHVDVDPTKHMWAPGLLHFKDMHQEPKGK